MQKDMVSLNVYEMKKFDDGGLLHCKPIPKPNPSTKYHLGFMTLK